MQHHAGRILRRVCGESDPYRAYGRNAYLEKVGAVMDGLDLVFKDLGITLKCSLKEAYDRKMSEQ